MISVEEALERILGHVQMLGPEEKPALECLGQVLAEDIYSPLDVPPLDNSAMDGYAVQAESTRGATPSSPRILEVIGEVAAGSTPQQEVSAGKAIRIMTGAAVPPGADTVVQFEDTDEVERRASAHLPQNQIGIFREVPPDLNIRRAGEDIRQGTLVLPRGTTLRPSEIGVLASLGRKTAPIIRRPEVAIIATGDELTEVGESLLPGRIYNSNTYSLAAQVLRTGAIPRVLGIARDTVEAVK
ncbi:MAG: molybdopterin molybdotransferase MoeA, partial [Dehalococcoidia bacterium]